jgi:hypothetical protein
MFARMTIDGSVRALLDEADRVAADGVRALRAALAHHPDWHRRFDDVVNVLELLDEADAHVELAQRAASASRARAHAASALALASRAHACVTSYLDARRV